MNQILDEEEANLSSNKEISTKDVNVETISKSEDHPSSKSLSKFKNSVLPDYMNEDILLKLPETNSQNNFNSNHKLENNNRHLSLSKFDDKPSFLEEPENVLLVRNKPSLLKCTVNNALNAWFECSSGDPNSLQTKQIGNYVDPQNGIRTIEIQIEVSKQNLEDHVKRINDIQANYKFNNEDEINKMKNSRNKQILKNNVNSDHNDQVNDASDLPLVKSEQTAAVQATNLQLKKVFNNLNETTTSLPTSASLLNNSNNFSVSSISKLIELMKSNEIYQFQCWCKAFGHHRTVESRKASIEISFNGGWSDWTEWSECNTKCGTGVQKRFRYCNNPPPINDGAKCEGESAQVNECYVPCSNQLHQWSSWSQWSTCSIDCKQVRSRQCGVKEKSLFTSFSSTDGCQGQDVQTKSCTGGLCKKIDRNKDFSFGNLPVPNLGSNNILSNNQLLHQFNSQSSSGNSPKIDSQGNAILPPFKNNNLINYMPSNIQPNSPSNSPSLTVSSDHQQIFILCSLLATSLLFLFLIILFLLFKQRKRFYKNKKTTILQLDKLGNEEQQQMLLLMQQHNSPQINSSLNRNTNLPAQILISGNNRGYLQQPLPLPPVQNNLNDLSEKMHLITRLNPAGTMIDHLLVRNNEQSSKHIKHTSPLNTINNGNNKSLPMTKNSSNLNINSNVSLTNSSVNSNPSHNSLNEDQSNALLTSNNKKFTQTTPLHSTLKNSPYFNNKLSLNKLQSSNYFQNKQVRQDNYNYRINIEEPDYAEPILQSLDNSPDLDKIKDYKSSINSQSNSSNRSPSDNEPYDNYDQFDNDQSDQYYDQCEEFTACKNTDYENEDKFYNENEKLNDNLDENYDNLESRPPLPKTLPPSYTSFNSPQRSNNNFNYKPSENFSNSNDTLNTNYNKHNSTRLTYNPISYQLERNNLTNKKFTTSIKTNHISNSKFLKNSTNY